MGDIQEDVPTANRLAEGFPSSRVSGETQIKPRQDAGRRPLRAGVAGTATSKQKKQKPDAGEGAEKAEAPPSAEGKEQWSVLVQTVWPFREELNTRFQPDPAIPLPGMCLPESKTGT